MRPTQVSPSRSSFLTSWLVLALGLAATTACADEPEKTFRNLTVSVPKLKKAPVIDGTVDAAEWKDAAMAPRLILWRDTEGDDRLTDEEKRVYWAYTDEGIYFAFQFQRPDNALEPVATVTQRDGQFWKKDDAIEVHFVNVPG
ncbi:MAG: hypothetical protein ACOYMV_12880, partial [Verrucomicrobiia bacterium]